MSGGGVLDQEGAQLVDGDPKVVELVDVEAEAGRQAGRHEAQDPEVLAGGRDDEVDGPDLLLGVLPLGHVVSSSYQSPVSRPTHRRRPGTRGADSLLCEWPRRVRATHAAGLWIAFPVACAVGRPPAPGEVGTEGGEGERADDGDPPAQGSRGSSNQTTLPSH